MANEGSSGGAQFQVVSPTDSIQESMESVRVLASTSEASYPAGPLALFILDFSTHILLQICAVVCFLNIRNVHVSRSGLALGLGHCRETPRARDSRIPGLSGITEFGDVHFLSL